jgi:2-desacetyl-2-hydroxyethyl bacteriochlorophyllide A dehydrogenase
LGFPATGPEEGYLRAAVLTGPGNIEVQDVAEPRGNDGDAVVRMASVGICGTDFKIVSGKIAVDVPRVIGHEIVGEVVVAPPGTEARAGSTVLVDPGITCGTCDQCRAGRGNICTRGWLLGRDRDGGLQELLAVPAANLYPLPAGIDPAAAPLLQVLATCIHGQRLSPAVPGAPVVVIGLGVTGFLHLQLAKRAGATPIVCTTRSFAKLQLAAELGADVTVAADAPDAVARVIHATGGGADLVIECVGSVSTLASAVEVAGIGGRILSYGTISQTRGEFPYYQLYYKELVVSHPRSANAADFPLAIDAVTGGHVRLAPLVSDRFPLSAVGEAIQAGQRSGALKVFVDL